MARGDRGFAANVFAKLLFNRSTGALVLEGAESTPVKINGGVVAVATSRDLAASDDGKVLHCTATVTLSVPAGLPLGFACKVITNGTTSIASKSTVPLLNGATTTLTRAAATAANRIVEIVNDSVVDSYSVTGA